MTKVYKKQKILIEVEVAEVTEWSWDRKIPTLFFKPGDPFLYEDASGGMFSQTGVYGRVVSVELVSEEPV